MRRISLACLVVVALAWHPVARAAEPAPAPARNGTGMLVGGSFVLLAGLSGIAMMAVGFPMARSARDLDDLDLDMRADRIRRGQNGNRLALGGLGLALTLIPAGTAMLVVGGARKHRSRKPVALQPALGRGVAGLSLSGRF